MAGYIKSFICYHVLLYSDSLLFNVFYATIFYNYRGDLIEVGDTTFYIFKDNTYKTRKTN
jgi:branched-subunit amino acid aminotransferase/4-amino-4-deoxychorismate lyase